MAICNTTPDSFFAGSRAEGPGPAMEFIRRAIDEGADMLDVGGESTRPGAVRVDASEQIRRTAPIIERLRALPGRDGEIPVSIDTTRAPVARAAIEAGADIINDVASGTEDEGILDLASEYRCGLVLMHRVTPPDKDRYSHDLTGSQLGAGALEAVTRFLASRIEAALSRGVDRSQIILDPGLGFGKTPGENLGLIMATGSLLALGAPVMSALSRKSFVGVAQAGAGAPIPAPEDRLPGTLALGVLHLAMGASIFRVHDPGPTRAALDAAWMTLRSP